MSLGSQDIAEARAERLEREAREVESADDVEYELGLRGFTHRRVQYLFLVARAKGHAEDFTNDFQVVVSYVPGRYSVTTTVRA